MTRDYGGHTHPLAALLATPPPDLGPGPRADVQPLQSLQTAIGAALQKQPLAQFQGQTARALVLLWHDHPEPAHAIVQDMATPEASYVHAILHRREPDYGNAKYWFHRVGSHACHESLAAEATELLKDADRAALRSKLLPGGRWDAFAFVDACEATAARKREEGLVQVLREIQAAEFRVLLDSLTHD
jgi:hypothetical protein